MFQQQQDKIDTGIECNAWVKKNVKLIDIKSCPQTFQIEKVIWFS